MEAPIIRAGEYIIHLEDRVIIKDSQFCKDSIGSDGWKLLRQMVIDYPDHSSVDTLDKVLETSCPSEDVARRRTKGIIKLRNLFGKESILNQYSYSYYFTINVSIVSQEEYDVLYFACSERKKQNDLRPIMVKTIDGSIEEMYVIKSFGLVKQNRDFVILSKDKPSSQQKYEKAFVTEVVEKSEGVFEMIGIDSPSVFAAVRLAMLEMSYRENVNTLTGSNLRLIEQIMEKRALIEYSFLEHPNTRKYFFEDNNRMPTDRVEYQQVISLANMFAPLFYEIEASVRKLPSAFKDSFLKYESEIYQAKAIEEANNLSPENWQYLSLPVI